MPKMYFSVLFHGSVDRGHPFADHHHFRPFVWGGGDGIIVRVQRKKFDAVVLEEVC
jgi:hypothetical protein